MKISISRVEIALMGCQGLAALYGIASELLPRYLPSTADFSAPAGYGVILAVVSLSMFVNHYSTAVEKADREESQERVKATLKDLKNERDRFAGIAVSMSSRVALSVPFHERDFYALWSTQVKNSKNCIDVTHLGTYPPKGRKGPEEKEYFDNLMQIYASTTAQVRRIERYSDDKKEWIRLLVRGFENKANCSLGVYDDPSTDEFPFAISVCRVDDTFAWLVALAEHDSSTRGYRDVMLTGRESVELIAEYFDKRLWRSTRTKTLVNHGVLTTDGRRYL